MKIAAHRAGFTLVELLIAMAVMALIVGALDQVAARVISTYHAVQASQELAPQARYALERMVMIVQESDQIQTPSSTAPTEQLVVSERLSDRYDNAARTYKADGDMLPDADTDADGLIDEGDGDPAEFVTFELDKTDAANWKLVEQMPDYATVATGDFKTRAVICEHVQAFTCTRQFPGVVAMTLTLGKGTAAVTVQTTARARWVD